MRCEICNRNRDTVLCEHQHDFYAPRDAAGLLAEEVRRLQAENEALRAHVAVLRNTLESFGVDKWLSPNLLESIKQKTLGALSSTPDSSLKYLKALETVAEHSMAARCMNTDEAIQRLDIALAELDKVKEAK